MSTSEASNENQKPDEKQGEPFNYDDILDHIGQIGKHQFFHFALLCFPAFFPPTFYHTFTAGAPKYRCVVNGCENETSTEFEPGWLNQTMPWNWTETRAGCEVYNYTWNEDTCSSEIPPDGLTLQPCDKWIYDTTVFDTTILTDFDLTCDNEWQQTFITTIFMVGLFFGSVSLSSISDIIGRRLAFAFCTFAFGVLFTSTAVVHNYVVLVVLTFFCGMVNSGVFNILNVWGVEAVGKKYRVICGFMYQIMFSLGGCVLGIIAYFVREWRTLQIIVSAPMFICVAYYWFLPESIRWLITKKRYEEAKTLILKAAKTNKKTVPPHLLVIPELGPVPESSTEVLAQGDVETASTSPESSNITGKERNDNILDLFRISVLRKRIFIMFLVWIAAVMGYYGITFSAVNLSGDFHLNFELSVLVEIPSSFLGMYLMDKLGRRATTSGCLVISGLACLATGLSPEDPAAIRITFSLIGKFFGSLVLAACYSITSELFHTPARSAALGLSSTFGRIGAIVSPTIAKLGLTVDPSLPYIIFASVNILVGLLCLLLPETNKVPLPATAQEAKDLEKYTLSCFCRRKKAENSNAD